MLLFNCVFVAYVNTLCDFNTSNVTIQLSASWMVFLTTYDFNTSNVTIKPFYSFKRTCTGRISIHLMLLLNGKDQSGNRTERRFQYI